MADPIDERHYAWKMIRAARRAHAAGNGSPPATSCDEVTALLQEAMEAGLDRAELIMALSHLGGRLLTVCNPADVSGDVCLT